MTNKDLVEVSQHKSAKAPTPDTYSQKPEVQPQNMQMLNQRVAQATPDLLCAQLEGQEDKFVQGAPLSQMLVPDVIKEHCRQDDTTQAMVSGTQTTEYLHLNNPKNYKFLPPQFINCIRSSGKQATEARTYNILAPQPLEKDEQQAR